MTRHRTADPCVPRPPRGILLILCLLVFGSPGVLRADTVTVFAASSLSNVLAGIAPIFRSETGHDVVFAHGGSSALARQIQQGAPADVFISANASWMDRLVADGLIAADTRFDVLGNAIALVARGTDVEPVPIGPDMELSARLGDGRLAMALVDAVPAGIYAKAALESLGQWDAVAPRVVQADNVRAALTLVAVGAAPLGIVYATDAAVDDRVSVVATFPADTHPPIVYPAGQVTGRGGPAVAAFLDLLRGPAARDVFTAAGFTVLTDPGRTDD